MNNMIKLRRILVEITHGLYDTKEGYLACRPDSLHAACLGDNGVHRALMTACINGRYATRQFGIDFRSHSFVLLGYAQSFSYRPVRPPQQHSVVTTLRVHLTREPCKARCSTDAVVRAGVKPWEVWMPALYRWFQTGIRVATINGTNLYELRAPDYQIHNSITGQDA